MSETMLKYKHLFLKRSGDSRFIVEFEPKVGWLKCCEVPETINISSIHVWNLNSEWDIISSAMRPLYDVVIPHYLENVNIIVGNKNVSGKLIKHDVTHVIILTENDEYKYITSPYIISYKNNNNTCTSTIDIELALVKKSSDSKLNITFTARGFNWDAIYICAINFTHSKISKFDCNVKITNSTNLPLEDIIVDLVSNTETNYNVRSMESMMNDSQPLRVDSEQTVIGTSIYKMRTPLILPEKMSSSFAFIRLESEIDCKIKLMYHIDVFNKHPYTIVKFVVPSSELFKDGLPYGDIECWDAESNTWLANSSIPISAPNDVVRLNLGSNNFILCETQMESNKIKLEHPTDNDLIQSKYQMQYIVRVIIHNNSDRGIMIYPYHKYGGSINIISSSVKHKLKKGKHNNRMLFMLPEIKSMSKVDFNYEIII